MKKIYNTTYLILSFALILNCFNGAMAQSLPPREFKQALEKKHGILIDVRSAEAYAAEHISGAINIDLSDNFMGRIDSLDRHKTYFIYCRSGIRSAEAVRKMEKAGFKNIYNLLGGITAWKEAGLEVMRNEGLQAHTAVDDSTSCN